MGRSKRSRCVPSFFQNRFPLTGAQRLPVYVRCCSIVQGCLIGEHQSIVVGRNKHEFVAVVAETELGGDLLRNLRAQMKKCVSTASSFNSELKTLVDKFAQQSKETDEVTLTRAIGANEDVKRPQ